MPATPIIARRAKIRINGAIAVQASEWSIEPQVDTIDCSNFEESVAGVDVGYKDYVNGLRGAQMTIQAWLRTDTNIFGTIYDGNYVSVRFYLQDIGSDNFYFPVALINKVQCSAKVNDLIRATITMMNRGLFFLPGQS